MLATAPCTHRYESPGPERAVPGIRVYPVPALDPPYDEPPVRLPAVPIMVPVTVPQRWITLPATGPGPVPTGTGRPADPATDEAVRAVRGFLTACVEVFNGYRPATHLRGVVQPGRYETVLAALGRRVPGRLCPDGGSPRGRAPVALRRVRVCQPATGAVEAAAVFSYGEGLSWALAVRMERVCGRWRCMLAQTVE